MEHATREKATQATVKAVVGLMKECWLEESMLLASVDQLLHGRFMPSFYRRKGLIEAENAVRPCN